MHSEKSTAGFLTARSLLHPATYDIMTTVSGGKHDPFDLEPLSIHTYKSEPLLLVICLLLTVRVTCASSIAENLHVSHL